jgi:hypothetical protein
LPPASVFLTQDESINFLKKEKLNMNEEPPQIFQLTEDDELFQSYVEGELRKAGIALQRFDKDRPNNYTVTTDKKIPEEIMSGICQHATSKGSTIKFRP